MTSSTPPLAAGAPQPAEPSDDEVGEWVGQHYAKHFPSMRPDDQEDMRDRYREAHGLPSRENAPAEAAPLEPQPRLLSDGGVPRFFINPENGHIVPTRRGAWVRFVDHAAALARARELPALGVIREAGASDQTAHSEAARTRSASQAAAVATDPVSLAKQRDRLAQSLAFLPQAVRQDLYARIEALGGITRQDERSTLTRVIELVEAMAPRLTESFAVVPVRFDGRGMTMCQEYEATEWAVYRRPLDTAAALSEWVEDFETREAAEQSVVERWVEAWQAGGPSEADSCNPAPRP